MAADFQEIDLEFPEDAPAWHSQPHVFYLRTVLITEISSATGQREFADLAGCSHGDLHLLMFSPTDLWTKIHWRAERLAGQCAATLATWISDPSDYEIFKEQYKQLGGSISPSPQVQTQQNDRPPLVLLKPSG